MYTSTKINLHTHTRTHVHVYTKEHPPTRPHMQAHTLTNALSLVHAPPTALPTNPGGLQKLEALGRDLTAVTLERDGMKVALDSARGSFDSQQASTATQLEETRSALQVPETPQQSCPAPPPPHTHTPLHPLRTRTSPRMV